MRRIFFILVVLCGVLFTGCAKLVNMDEQESAMVAEYMAGTVLRHTIDYNEALIYPDYINSQETEEDANPVNGTAVKDKAVKDTVEVKDSVISVKTEDALKNTQVTAPKTQQEVTYTQLLSALGAENFDISYSKYKEYESYPAKTDYFTIVPSKGKRLIVLSFQVKNLRDKKQILDLSEAQADYQLVSSDNSTYKAMMTLLPEDLQYINQSIGAGESQEAVLVFEITRDKVISDFKLRITYKGTSSTLDIKE